MVYNNINIELNKTILESRNKIDKILEESHEKINKIIEPYEDKVYVSINFYNDLILATHSLNISLQFWFSKSDNLLWNVEKHHRRVIVFDVTVNIKKLNFNESQEYILSLDKPNINIRMFILSNSDMLKSIIPIDFTPVSYDTFKNTEDFLNHICTSYFHTHNSTKWIHLGQISYKKECGKTILIHERCLKQLNNQLKLLWRQKLKNNISYIMQLEQKLLTQFLTIHLNGNKVVASASMINIDKIKI